MKEVRSGDWSPALSESEQATLFAIASDTLAWCVAGRKGDFDLARYELTDALTIPTATFVTLKLNGQLRGCIGSLAPVASLAESVHDNAVNAALHDTRFRPVSVAECARLELHISILSPIRDITTLDAFILGEHGIILRKGMHRAVYLPEVATEQRWTRDQTLASLSQKAGMPEDGWREGARFQIFSSVVLSNERVADR